MGGVSKHNLFRTNVPAVPAQLVQGRAAVPGVEAEDAHSTCPHISVDATAVLAASLVVCFF